jgi:hypothetical protein
VPPADYEGIVVLGMPRSGTTLVRRLLDSHPAVCCPPETNLLNASARFLQEELFAGGLAVGVVPGLDFSGFDEATVLERLRAFVFSFFRDIAARQGKRRWAEKTAVDIFHLDQIERLCAARCRFVCVFRHALDDVCSIKELADKMEMHMAELHAYVARHPAPYEAFAHAWVDANRRLLRFCSTYPDRSLRIRYEDLVTHPAEQLEQLCEFLGEPTDVRALLAAALGSRESAGLGDWKTYGMSAITAHSVGRWKQLSPWTIRRLAPIVRDVMDELGYDPIPVPAATPSDDDRRMQQISRMVAGLKLRMDTPSGD